MSMNVILYPARIMELVSITMDHMFVIAYMVGKDGLVLMVTYITKCIL